MDIWEVPAFYNLVWLSLKTLNNLSSVGITICVVNPEGSSYLFFEKSLLKL